MMKKSYRQYMELGKKNKATLHILWYSVFLLMFVEILDYVIYQFVEYTFVIENYFFRYIVTPFIYHILIAVSCTLLYRNLNKKNTVATSYIMIIGFTLFTQEIIMIHYGVSVIYMSYAIPIFLSILFNNKRMTFIIGLICISFYIPLYFFYLPTMPDYTYKHDFMDFTATLVFLAASFIVSIFIMDAFNELIQKIIEAESEKRTLERELMLDPFTKLYNKATFDSLLRKSYQDFMTNGSVFSILVIDIDNFKNVNDTYGHAFGDKVILVLVDVIKSNIRTTDYAFRYGGEEFTVILYSEQPNAMMVAEKIREKFNNESIKEHENLRFSISIGISEINQTDKSYETIFENADKALYEAKHSGKNRVHVTSEKKYIKL